MTGPFRSSRLTTRRTIAAAATAALVAAGLTVAIGSASAAACPAWTDEKGDATTGQEPTGLATDAQMDIVGASLGTQGDTLVATISTDGLSDSSSDQGDEFSVSFLAGDLEMTVGLERTSPPVVGGVGEFVFVSGPADYVTDGLTATVDPATKTVTVVAPFAAVDAAAGASVAGKTATGLVARTSNQTYPVGSAAGFLYDEAPTDLTTVLGTSCEAGGAPAPTGEPTAEPAVEPSGEPTAEPTGEPTAEPSGEPTGEPGEAPAGAPAAASYHLPDPDCFTYADVKGDAVVSPLVGGPGLPNDPDLDLVGITLQSTPEVTRAFLQVDKLATRPATTPGHAFYAYFTAGDKVVQMITTGYDPATFASVQQGLADATEGTPAARAPLTRLVVAGATVASSITGVFDVAHSTVTLSIPTEELTAATGDAFVAGAVLQAVSGRDTATTPAGGLFVDSTAAGNAAAATEKETWKVGDNACFTGKGALITPAATPTPSGEPSEEPSGEPTGEPTSEPTGEPTSGPTGGPTTPASSSGSSLSASGMVRVQHSDALATTVTLTDSQGQPLVSRQVTGRLGNGPVAKATTNASGKATLSTLASDSAGTRSLVLAYAGDEAHSKSSLTRSITVVTEATRLTKSVSGSGSTRTVTMRLTDDDGKALSGRTVVFQYSGKTVTVKTDSAGRASVTAGRGAAMDVTFRGESSRYAAVKVSTYAQ